ncbi:MAG: SPOR domain-containing protein, partial [Crocinitomicaceae bacterium]|nr:SPOR domain-containing protein [Crocinitomicaceae bacterium]
GNISSTNSENGNLGSNQELGNPEIANSNRTSTENGDLGLNPELIQEKISRFERELLAISMMNSDELPTILPKIERLGLSNEELESLEQQLTLPARDATEPDVDVEAYVNYTEQRRVFEQTKIELVRNQQELRAIEEDFRAENKEQLAALILEQARLQNRLSAQQRALVALPNQAVYEALLQQNYRPQVSAAAVQNSAVGSASVALNTFQLQEKPAQTQATPLPVGLPCPEGLVFRVQVGAFRKPVPAERFREFTPVDGQVLANGLTVYMAGYFGSSAEALQQQKLIRTLGYPDAFVVAYQNCSRLSLAQGRALESTTTLAQTQNVANNSLFAGPGQGLYYTVQVGVYNRPLTSEAQIGLSELIEAKTAKGQYRYASGKFTNLKDAKTRQQLAVNKGITDAFIVAYYQGKRIDLAQARLLAQSGIAFEQNFEQNQVPALSAELQQKLLALELPQTQPLKVPDPVVRYEIKCTACQEALSRYNRAGVFIYDPEKEVIVSALQKASDWDVVQLMYLKEMRKKTVALKGASQTLVLDPEGVDGAFVDWLLRQQNGYELVKDKDGKLEIRYLVPDAN